MIRLDRAMERRLHAALRLRRRDSAGQTVDRSALYVGAAYTFSCRHCGALGEAWAEHDHGGPAQSCCDDCAWLLLVGYDFASGAFSPFPPLPLNAVARFFTYVHALGVRLGPWLADLERDDGEFHLDNPVI